MSCRVAQVTKSANPTVCMRSVTLSVPWFHLSGSISRSTAVRIRRSAGIRSPVVKVTRSPGTTSLARRCILFFSVTDDVTVMGNELVECFK
jgi:hypothetical protein